MNLHLRGALQLATSDNIYLPLACHFQAPWRVCKSLWKKDRAKAGLEGSFSSLPWCWEEQKQMGPKVITHFPVEPCGVSELP